MRIKPRRWVARYGRRLGLLAALLTLSLAPRTAAGVARANSNATTPLAGVSYTLSLSGNQSSGNSLIADLGTRTSSIATVACVRPDPRLVVSFDGHAAATPLLRGGSSLLARASGLPPGRAFRLLLDVPRARRSANISVPITYSLPTIAAASDAGGNLVDTVGNPGVRVALPLDAASGAGTLSLIEQGVSLQPAARTRPLIVAPHAPVVEVHALDAAGRAVPGANVRLRGEGGVSCSAQADALGNLLLTNVPAGTATVSIARGNHDLGTYHPDTVAGETTVLRRAPDDKFHPNPTTTHALQNCDTKTGYVYAMLDTASGLPTGRSGEGPFGVFLSGISTVDTFTAHVTSKAADGILGPIRHDVPIAVSVDTALHATVAVHAVVGADVHGGVPAGFTSVSFKLDVGQMPAGTNYVTVTVGTGNNSCIGVYMISVANDPTNTPLGTVSSYFDPASNSYQVDGVLPTHPKLQFNQPIDLTLPSQSLGAAQLPAAQFYTFQNEGEIGLEVHETIHTDGSWSGTVGGHARLIFFGYTIVNQEIPQLQGGGPSLSQGRMSRSFHLYGKSIDASLYDYVIYLPQYGIILVLNVRFSASGDLDVAVGVPATMSEADFTIAPTFTGRIIGSSTLVVPIIGSISASLAGSLGLAAPITLQIPGGTNAHVGMLISVTANFDSPFGSTSPARLLKPTCLGDCGPAGQSIHPLIGPIVVMTAPGVAPAGISTFTTSRTLANGHGLLPATITFKAGVTAPDTQPATALAPDGSPATLWLTRRGDGATTLLAQIGHGAPQTLATNSVALASPRIAWLGPRHALAVWMASTAAPDALAQLRAASPDARPALLQALLASQQLFSAQWDGTRWSSPMAITTGDSLNAEPSLAADPAGGRAVLAWVRGPLASISAAPLAGLSVATMTFAQGAWLAPRTVSTAGTSGVNMPSVALDARGNAGVAWLDGPIGAGRPMFAALGAAYRSAPIAVTALPAAAQRIDLAFDAAGRPVIVAEVNQALTAARRESTGHWTAWSLGAGTMPRLARGAASSVVLLAERPSLTPASRLAYQPIMAVLAGTRWSPRVPLAASTATQATDALAVNPATGRVRVVLGSRPAAGFAATDGFWDRASALSALDIPPGDASTLAPVAITLSDSHPSPGERITVDVRVRNLATTPVAPGAPVRVRIAFAGRAIVATLRTTQPIAAGGTVTLHVPLAAPAAPLVVTAAAGRSRAEATLGLPEAPRDVTVTAGASGGGPLIQWEAGSGGASAGYRVYRYSNGGAPVLAGFAHGTTWADDQGTAAGRYAVAAVDSVGRASPIAASR